MRRCLDTPVVDKCSGDVTVISGRDVVLGLGPWSLVVLKDKIEVLGPGLELQVLG